MKEGWEIKKLDEVCEVNYGTRVVRKRDGGSIYPVYGGGGATFKMDTYNREDSLVVARFAMSEKCTRFVKGKFFLNDSGLTVKSKNINQILPKFLNYQMFSLNDYIYSLARGSAQKNLNVPAFRNTFITYPKSIKEQERIVAILDDAFTAIDSAKSIAEQNLANTQELFESYLNSVFEAKGEDWEESTIGELCNLMTGGTPSRAKEEYFNGGEIKWLVSGDIHKEEIYDCQGRITDLGQKNSNAHFLPVNSVLIALNGQGKTRGTVAMLRTRATCNQSLVSIYPKNENTIIPELIYMNLKGRYNEIRRLTGDSGNDRRGLNMRIIRGISFSYPKSLEEQKEIVEVLDALSEETQRLEGVYRDKISNFEELKKSLLEKAFKGEL